MGLNLRNSFLFKYFITFSFSFLPVSCARFVSYQHLNQYCSIKVVWKHKYRVGIKRIAHLEIRHQNERNLGYEIFFNSMVVIQENYLEIIGQLFDLQYQNINGSINHVVLCWVVNHFGCYNSPFDATMGCGLLSVLEMSFVSSQLPTGNINKSFEH